MWKSQLGEGSNGSVGGNEVKKGVGGVWCEAFSQVCELIMAAIWVKKCEKYTQKVAAIWIRAKAKEDEKEEGGGGEGVGKAGCQRVARMSRYSVAVSMSQLIWHSEHARLSCQFHLAASFLLVPLSFFLQETEEKRERVMEKQDKWFKTQLFISHISGKRVLVFTWPTKRTNIWTIQLTLHRRFFFCSPPVIVSD